MRVIVPMAGDGMRFKNAGFANPKPFIGIYGKPMIRQVIESVNLPEAEYLFLCKESHLAEFSMKEIFGDLNFKIMPVHKTTEGAAVTISMAKDFFPVDEEILIVNSDQLFHYNSNQVREVLKSSLDGCIWCFHGNSPKWSYVKLDDTGNVTQVAEKKQISNIATGGMYYWKSYYQFLESAGQMMKANDRVNNEFYAAPVYNYLPKGSRVEIRMLNGIDQLGTPEDLIEYENQVRIHRDN